MHAASPPGNPERNSTIKPDLQESLRLRRRTRIEEWQPPGLFADSQESGPYRSWWHEHRYEPDGDRTLVADPAYYARRLV